MKNKQENTKKKLNHFIKISLIIHLILLIILLLFTFKYTDKKKYIPIPKQPPKFKIKRQAKLSPRKSEHGIAPFTEEKAQFKKPKTKILGPEKQKGGIEIEKAFQKAENSNSKKIQKQKSAQKQKPKKQTRIRIKRPQEKKQEQEQEKLIKNFKVNDFKKEVNTKKSLDNKENIKNQIKKIEINQTEIKTPPPKIEKFKTVGLDEKNSIPDIKPKKSIIGMTTGFIENLKQKGNDWLERDGDENIKPNYEDLKYISYEESIQWHLQQSRNTHFTKNKMFSNNQTSRIHFTIDKDGNIYEIQLIESSGDSNLDEEWIKVIKLAAPFPPIPQHFKTELYSTGRKCFYGSAAFGY